MAAHSLPLYTQSNASFLTFESDSTVQVPGEYHPSSTSSETGWKRSKSKSVAFSVVTQTISPDDVYDADDSVESPSSSLDKPLPPVKQDYPVLRNSQNFLASTSEHPGGDGRGGEATLSRKRRFSGVSPFSSEGKESYVEPSSPRKRKFSGIPSVNNELHSADIQPPRVPDKDKPPSASAPPHPHPRKETTRVLHPPTTQPPADICDEVNQRIRTTFDQPSFDFAQHILHRTYVVRTIHFSPAEACVTMLDEGVDHILPPKFPPPPSCAKDNFVIDQAGDKGQGVFARRAIADGQPVLVERPVIMTPYVVGLAVPLSQIYVDMFRKLSPGVLKELMALSVPANEKQGTETAEAEVYEAIMRVNALAIALEVPTGDCAELNTHRAVFVNVSRCNHSCGPNAKWEWDKKSFSLVLTALRPIKAGEEITIAYVPPHLPHDTRQAELRRLFAFNCTCPFCTQPRESLEQGDTARAKLASFWDPSSPNGLPSFDEWCSDLTLSSTLLVEAHLDAIALIHREGLHLLDTQSAAPGRRAHPRRDLGRHIDSLAMCYGALGDLDHFQRWIERAADCREGERPETRLAFRKWMSNPVSFPVWGLRKANSSSRAKGKRTADARLSADIEACIRMGIFARD